MNVRSYEMAVLRRKASELWMMRKLVVEGGLVQKQLYDIGWSDEKDVKDVARRKAQRNTGSVIVRRGKKSDMGSPRNGESGSRQQKCPNKIDDGKEDSLRTLQMKASCTGASGQQRWVSKQHRNWGWPDGSLFGASGKWERGCSGLQLNDGNEGPMFGTCGTLQANLEVQRTIKRAKQTVFCASSGKLSVSHTGQQRNYKWAMERRSKVCGADSQRCRFVDLNLGGKKQDLSRRKRIRGEACEGTQRQGVEEYECMNASS